jgi:hypothetical protein
LDQAHLSVLKGAKVWASLMIWLMPAHAMAQLDDAQWVSPDADLVSVLQSARGECLALPDDPEARMSVLTGRAAFRSSTLMGGHAARRGLSCNSCHRNGHGNPDFFIEALSDQPGQVDVTNGVFSSHRDDSTFNPVPIPTLVNAGSKPEFGTVIRTETLRAFISGILNEEFDARPPPTIVFEGLAAYIESLESGACPEEATAPYTLEAHWHDIDTLYQLISWHLNNDSPETVEFLIGALRHELGRISQHFVGQNQLPARLKFLSMALNGFQLLLATGNTDMGTAFASLRVSLDDLGRDLAAKADDSLYNPEILKLVD